MGPEAEDEDDEPHVVHGKSDEQRKRLTKVVEPMLLFKSLDADQFSQILDAMFEKVVEPGDCVIKEGDDGDYFYIIESGKYDIFKIIGDENKHVGQYDNKGSFGELALMYNAPRAATISANDGGSLWAMDRQTFRRIVVKETAKNDASMKDSSRKSKFWPHLRRMNVLRSPMLSNSEPIPMAPKSSCKVTIQTSFISCRKAPWISRDVAMIKITQARRLICAP